jgi:hypothetical protein
MRNGQCTPLYCVADEGPARRFEQPSRAPAGEGTEEKRLATVEADAEQDAKFDVVRRKVRAKMVEQPSEEAAQGGEAAEGWADSKLVRLLPLAVAEVEYQLNYGDDKQRMEAADRVLKATGRSTREAGIGGGQTIVLNISSSELPWGRKATTINAQVTTGEAQGSEARVLQSGEPTGAARLGEASGGRGKKP